MFRVWELIETGKIPRSLTNIFTSQNYINSCYPEGNFECNQLLDGSMSLSPLYAN